MRFLGVQKLVANGNLVKRRPLALAVLLLLVTVWIGCELPNDPNAAEKPKVEEVKEKKPAETYLGKAMESANKLKNETVPNYNRRLEKLNDPFAK